MGQGCNHSVTAKQDGGRNGQAVGQFLKEMLSKADPRYHVHGTHEVVAGLEGQKRVYDLTAAFVRRGYTGEHIRLIRAPDRRSAAHSSTSAKKKVVVQCAPLPGLFVFQIAIV